MKGLLALVVFYILLNGIVLVNVNHIPHVYIWVLMALDAVILLVAVGRLK